MKRWNLTLGLLLAAIPAATVAANLDKDAVKTVIKAVKNGTNLAAAFPGAISEREINSLRRVARCDPVNLMRQKGGYYTVVWDCGSKGALGMKVMVEGGKVTSISSMEIGIRPNTGSNR